jgi:hypothetical protein
MPSSYGAFDPASTAQTHQHTVLVGSLHTVLVTRADPLYLRALSRVWASV